MLFFRSLNELQILYFHIPDLRPVGYLKGSVQLDLIKSLPPYLYYFSNEKSHFKAVISGSNSALAFTSVNYSRNDHIGFERGGIESF